MTMPMHQPVSQASDMIIFHAPDIEATRTLPEAESHHAIKVLRLRCGDEIVVIDGNGSRFRCVLTDTDARGASVEIVEKTSHPLPWSCHITVAVAPTKNSDRIDWLMEKLTELGINRFVPVICHRSVRRDVKSGRLLKIAVSATKQSLKSVVPEILPATPIEHIGLATGDDTQRFVAYCSDEVAPRGLLSRLYKPGADAALLIGPEGDFTSEEIQTLIADGWVPVSLGDTRLRTETAALAACQTIHIVNQLAD